MQHGAFCSLLMETKTEGQVSWQPIHSPSVSSGYTSLPTPPIPMQICLEEQRQELGLSHLIPPPPANHPRCLDFPSLCVQLFHVVFFFSKNISVSLLPVFLRLPSLLSSFFLLRNCASAHVKQALGRHFRAEASQGTSKQQGCSQSTQTGPGQHSDFPSPPPALKPFLIPMSQLQDRWCAVCHRAWILQGLWLPDWTKLLWRVRPCLECCVP